MDAERITLLRIEYRELYRRMEKLDEFLQTMEFNLLTRYEQILLSTQMIGMRNYANALYGRICYYERQQKDFEKD